MKRFLLVLLIFGLALPACQRQTERELNRLDFIIQDSLKTTFSLEKWEKPKNPDQESQKLDIISLLDMYPEVDVPGPQLTTDGYFFALYYEREIADTGSIFSTILQTYILFVNHGGDRLIGYMSNSPVLEFGSVLKGMSHMSLMEKLSCRNFKDDIEETRFWYREYQREYNFRKFDIKGSPTESLEEVMALAELPLEEAIELEDESGTIRHVIRETH